MSADSLADLARDIRTWGTELGFQQTGITGIDLPVDEERLQEWLKHSYHGSMEWMRRHGHKRSRPAQLLPGTMRVISLRMDYWAETQFDPVQLLASPDLAYVARYSLGRDYHRIIRSRLKKLVARIQATGDTHFGRVFVDSAPVLEKPLAQNAGLGWIGKHTNLINRDAGSWFLLGEIYTDLPLPVDKPSSDHCGSCTRCIEVCPTRAIVAPYVLDARRCISYLTIENRGPIPREFRIPMGNRIFGCDDCQLFCPWNKFARPSKEPDFQPRHGLDAPQLTQLFGWKESEWLKRTEGSAIRRAGYLGWLRNIAVALGNASPSPAVRASLKSRASHASDLVREHVRWALARLDARSGHGVNS